jgi:anti-anti-sigma regulatory factor
MPPRLRVRRREREGRHVFAFEGEIDGSTACHALDVLGRTPLDGRELVLDFSGLTGVQGFGLEVLSRGLRQVARERRVRILDAPSYLPPLTWLASTLRSERAA